MKDDLDFWDYALIMHILEIHTANETFLVDEVLKLIPKVNKKLLNISRMEDLKYEMQWCCNLQRN